MLGFPAVEPPNNDNERRRAILDHWLRLEYFTPFDPGRDADSEHVISVLANRDLPWVDPDFATKHPPGNGKDDPPRKDKRWALAHAAYVGRFRVSESAQAVRTALGDNRRPVEDPPGYGCFARLDLNEHGHWAGALTLSTLPWAVGRVIAGQHRSDTWEDDFRAFVGRAGSAIRLPVNQPATIEALKDAGRALHELAGWVPKAAVPTDVVLIWRWQFIDCETQPDAKSTAPQTGGDAKAPSEREDEKEPPEILNGFFIADLARIKAAVAADARVGATLARYLDAAPSSDRVDLFADNDALSHAVSPSRVPTARWPSADDSPLNLMQQAAVNLVVNPPEGAKAGAIFSVNGPPGTGKTTLLRDVIAAVITRRAEALAAIDRPEHSFTQRALPGGGRFSSSIWEPPAAIVGHEMVVASSNNRAVENITTEIPGWSAIAEYYQGRVSENGRYFGKLADLLGARGDEPAKQWGLLAAVLGKRSHRDRFRTRFWFEKKKTSIRSYLKKPLCDPPPDWNATRATFQAARRRVLDMQQQLIALEGAAAEAIDVRAWLDKLEARRVELEDQRRQLTTAITNQDQSIECVRQRRERSLAELEALGRTNPGWPAWIFAFSRMRQYLRDCGAVRTELTHATTELRAAEIERERLSQGHAGATEELWKVLADLQDAGRMLDDLEAQLATGRRLLNLGADEPFATDPEFWRLPSTQVHCGSPWSTPAFNQARAELFLAALRLHQAFVMRAAPAFAWNLSMLADVLGDARLRDEHREYTRWLWQTLFLVVPVVSTTFASVGQMFRDVGAQELGWLFIDEAGQAAPQAAAGALWRAQRAVVVGDPQQLEPVVTVPESIGEDLRRGRAFLADYDPTCGHSVQTIADRVCRYGASVPQPESEDQSRWVGCPLVVHRRCLDPMFSLANEIAYGNRMIAATTSRSSLPDMPASCWIHVEGHCETKHWVPNQWPAVHALIQPLLDKWRADGTAPSLYLVSPFRLVAAALKKKLAPRLEHLRADERREWLKNAVGTVHTFQGKEADVVVLVLGADEDSVEAAGWAASRPNLLNVAATRARQRLYIVGDERLWSGLRYFDTARSLLQGAQGR